ncbi:MAG: alpha/beta hydrolase [Spirochaetes bacterium]|nr:alpha/beta hydrolase [Spirochaetota bacterium]
MKRALLIIPVVLVIAVAALYLFPCPSPPFTKIYGRVDQSIAASLASFRKDYSARELVVDGARWRYCVAGSGGRTVLFLHGMTGACDIWWQQVLDLQGDYRVLSVTYPPVRSLSGLAAGIMRVLDSEKIERVNVVGTSLGGYLAQYLVARHPERIDRAVFANTFPPNTIIARKNRAAGTVLPLAPSWVVMGILRKNTEEKLYPAAERSELVRAFMLEQSHGKMSRDQFIARYHCVIDPFTPPDVEALRIPVMIIESDNDPLVEPALRGMLKRTYPGARVVTLHNKGHFPYLNEPAMYTSLLRDFFR